MRTLAAGAALAASVVGACTGGSADSTSASDRADALVEAVIDGDTIEVRVDGRSERVRLIGIDTPELANAERGQQAECFSREATMFARSLLPVGTEVLIERDIEPRDDYGRLLGYVYRADDAIFVNYELARQGFAQPLTIPPNVTYHDRFVRAARAAERDNLGLWASCR